MISYSFAFANEESVRFDVDETTGIDGPAAPDSSLPDWLKLSAFRCAHCTLPDDPRRVCPAIHALRPILSTFGNRISYEEVKLTVEMSGMTITAATTAQEGARSLIGLTLALSGCPTMRMLSPMARFHWPLASSEASVFRVFGTWLIGQRLRQQKGLVFDDDLSELRRLYREIHQVNDRLADRIRAATPEDAAVNGLFILDVFAHTVDWGIKSGLEQLAPVFSDYLA